MLVPEHHYLPCTVVFRAGFSDLTNNYCRMLSLGQYLKAIIEWWCHRDRDVNSSLSVMLSQGQIFEYQLNNAIVIRTTVSRVTIDSTPERNGPHFPDGIFKHIFLNENAKMSIKISLKFVPNGLSNNIPELVHITAWHRPGDKPLSEPMMVNILAHICVKQSIGHHLN